MSKIAIILSILLLAGFLRFWNLDNYPIQLNHDEVSQIYDAYSILQTGKDIYGNHLPLAFLSTGDYKVGHYIYLSLPFVYLFGIEESTIRIPSAFFGTMTIFATFLFVYQLVKLSGQKKSAWKIGIICALIVTILPSEIFYSRKSFENVLGCFFVILGFYFLLRFVEKAAKEWLILGVLCSSSAMYLYTSHTLTVPMMVLLFLVIFRKHVISNWRIYLSAVIFWIIISLPLLWLMTQNQDIRFRARTVFITRDVMLGRQLENSPTWTKTFFDYLINRYLKQFDIVYLFGNGLNLTNQGYMGVGPLLLIQFPLLLFGVFYLVRNKFERRIKLLLFGLILISFIPSAITFEVVSPHRSELGFIFLSIISGFGLYSFLQIIYQVKKLIQLRYIFLSIVFGLILVNFIYFWHIYTVNYSYEKSQYLHYPFAEISRYIFMEFDNFDQIIIDPLYGQAAPVRAVAIHYYLGYYGKYSPLDFQKEYRRDNNGESLNKISIRKVNWYADSNLKNTLVIASPWSLPKREEYQSKIIKTFYFYDHQVAYYVLKI